MAITPLKTQQNNKPIPVADPGGAAGAHPRNGTQFVCFHIHFRRKMPMSEVGYFTEFTPSLEWNKILMPLIWLGCPEFDPLVGPQSPLAFGLWSPRTHLWVKLQTPLQTMAQVQRLQSKCRPRLKKNIFKFSVL